MSDKILKPLKSDGRMCMCGICGTPHIRREGKVNLDNPICQKCADTYGGIPSGHHPKDKVNIKMRNWK